MVVKYKRHKKQSDYISIIIPVDNLSAIFVKLRNKYDFFASVGVPTHITFLYKIPLNVYYKKESNIKIVLKKILKIFNKIDTFTNDIIELPNMYALELNKTLLDIIIKIQKIMCKYLDIKDKKYNDINFRPHITLFTGAKNPGWEKVKVLNLKKHLPIKLNLSEIRILRINPRQSIPTTIHKITIK